MKYSKNLIEGINIKNILIDLKKGIKGRGIRNR